MRSYAQGGASALLIVGGRYMIELRMRPRATEAEVERLAAELPLGELAADGGGAAGHAG